MIKLIIVSHKRASTVTTTKVVHGCSICIPESQKEEYEKYNDCELITHPDSIVGLSPKRQWIIENYGDVFMLDDDITYCMRTYVNRDHDPYGASIDPKTIFYWIQDLYHLCKKMDIKLFGFSAKANRMGYPAHKPFEFNKYITGGAFGLLKNDKLYFPNIPDFVGEDYFINALNAYHYRRSLIDRRVAFAFDKTEGNPGGCADYRTEEKRKETYMLLKKYFGDAIKKKRTTTIKKIKSKWEKTLIVPY